MPASELEETASQNQDALGPDIISVVDEVVYNPTFLIGGYANEPCKGRGGSLLRILISINGGLMG